jgi:hypothetical protein
LDRQIFRQRASPPATEPLFLGHRLKAAAECLREGGVAPRDTRDAAGGERFNAFGPVRSVRGDVHSWWYQLGQQRRALLLLLRRSIAQRRCLCRRHCLRHIGGLLQLLQLGLQRHTLLLLLRRGGAQLVLGRRRGRRLLRRRLPRRLKQLLNLLLPSLASAPMRSSCWRHASASCCRSASACSTPLRFAACSSCCSDAASSVLDMRCRSSCRCE